MRLEDGGVALRPFAEGTPRSRARRSAASIRVAEKAGFRREALLRSYIELHGARRDVYLYSLLPEEL